MFLCDIGKDDNRFLTFPILPRIIAIDMRNDYQIQPSNGISDEKLCRLARQGDGPAMENLIRRYTRLVNTCARPYFLAGADAEDLMQDVEGYLEEYIDMVRKNRESLSGKGETQRRAD